MENMISVAVLKPVSSEPQTPILKPPYELKATPENIHERQATAEEALKQARKMLTAEFMRSLMREEAEAWEARIEKERQEAFMASIRGQNKAKSEPRLARGTIIQDRSSIAYSQWKERICSDVQALVAEQSKREEKERIVQASREEELENRMQVLEAGVRNTVNELEAINLAQSNAPNIHSNGPIRRNGGQV